MDRKRKSNIVKRKRNFWIILLGSFVIFLFLFLANLIYEYREVRMTGQLITAPIVDISYATKGGNSGFVKVDGKILAVSRLDSSLEIGDSIQVRYDKEKAIVVQEKFDEGSFIVFFALDSVLLVLGLSLVYAGITGKGYS
ncbi:MAG: hypothetical protein QM751_13580 [Paludibacteraceae bacterium]